MINRAFVIRGKVWGERLKRRLNKPPVGVLNWYEQHTHTIKSDGLRTLAVYYMRDLPCFLKLYRRKTPFHLLAYALHMGKPLRTFKNSMRMAVNGVPIPRPFCCVLVRDGVLVLSKGLDSGGTYCEIWQSRPAHEQVQRMMRGAGKTIASAHDCGFSHGDCNWDNLMWSENECYLVELETARKMYVLKKRGMARDLARFTVAAEEAGVGHDLLEIFLQSYIEESGDKRDELVERMQPHLERLRNRHEKQMGIVAQPLI